MPQIYSYVMCDNDDMNTGVIDEVDGVEFIEAYRHFTNAYESFLDDGYTFATDDIEMREGAVIELICTDPVDADSAVRIGIYPYEA